MKCRLEKQAEQYWQVLDNRRCTLLNPWQVTVEDGSLSELSAENILPYLTSMEADLALLTWFRLLDIGGRISISVPDSDYFMQLWLGANWNEQTLRNPESAARKSFHMLWGQQLGGNPRNADYNDRHGDVFKSAYNEKRLTFLLQRAGFVDVSIIRNGIGKLSATARKSMHRGERQIAPSFSNIRADHRNRYQFACQTLLPLTPGRILDLASGIGYGSQLLSKTTGAEVVGVDIDAGAIEYARQFYADSHTTYLCEDARKLDLPAEHFDAVVCLETLEHIDFEKVLLDKFYYLLKKGGVLICSTPNQAVLPFDKIKFPFHIKHYTNSELLSRLSECGFCNVKLFAQHDLVSKEVVAGEDGCITVAVANKN